MLKFVKIGVLKTSPMEVSGQPSEKRNGVGEKFNPKAIS